MSTPCTPSLTSDKPQQLVRYSSRSNVFPCFMIFMDDIRDEPSYLIFRRRPHSVEPWKRRRSRSCISAVMVREPYISTLKSTT
eukprot:1194954-Prorocentrum_minimum.AAC.4